MSIEIVPYRNCWPEEYRAIAETVRRAVPNCSSIHHIGSTAVPGLAAKDIIDVQVTVANLRDVDVADVSRRGFCHVAGLEDHAPPGMQLPRRELAKLYFRRTDRPIHLHIRERGRFNQRYALLCRDYLGNYILN